MVYLKTIINRILQRSFLLLVLNALLALHAKSQKLNIMSYNIHHGADKDERNMLDSMGYFIKQQNPDLVGLQEVDSVCERSGKIDQMKRLAEITGMHYAFVRHFPYEGGAYGVGILSKYRLLKVENKTLRLLKRGPNGESVAMLFSTIKLSKKKSILFITAHYSAFDKATRQSQVNETIHYLSANRLPVIFTGDLNATPDAEEIQLLQKHLQTTDKPGVYTFPDDVPVKKIDYILVSKGALKKVTKVSAPGVHYSDHLPFVSTIVLK